MQRQFRRTFLDELENSRVRDDQPIGFHAADRIDIFFQFWHVFVVRKQVQRQIRAFAVGVAELHPLDHILKREL